MSKTKFLKILYFSSFLALLPILSCAQKEEQLKLKPKEALFRQYSFLLQESYEYTIANKNLLSSIQKFIDSCKEYDFYRNNRLAPIILQPILFNNNKDKLLAMILTREYDLEGKSVEYIHFIYGDKKNSDWFFHLKQGYTRSFSYENKYPILSDQEMTLIVLRNLIDSGYMQPNGFKINDDFFKDEW